MKNVIGMLGNHKGAIIKGAAVVGSAVVVGLVRSAIRTAKVKKGEIIEFPIKEAVQSESPTEE